MEKVHAKKTWCKWKNCALKVTTGARLVGSAHGGSFPTCLIPRKNARLNAPHESHLGGPWRLVACWGHSPCGSLGLLHPALLSLRFTLLQSPRELQSSHLHPSNSHRSQLDIAQAKVWGSLSIWRWGLQNREGGRLDFFCFPIESSTGIFRWDWFGWEVILWWIQI